MTTSPYTELLLPLPRGNTPVSEAWVSNSVKNELNFLFQGGELMRDAIHWQEFQHISGDRKQKMPVVADETV